MSSEKQQIRFCTTGDGVRIAYATTGEGPPPVKVASWMNRLEFDWESPVWRHWIAELARDHSYVRYDERGSGLSDWDVRDLSFEAWVRSPAAIGSRSLPPEAPSFAIQAAPPPGGAP